MTTVEQRVDILKRTVAGILLVPAVGLLLCMAWLVIVCRFGPANIDPQGYTLIFGTVLGLVSAICVAVMITWRLSRERRALARRWILLGFLTVTAGFLAALLTA